MDAKLYSDIHNFVQHGTLPLDFPSTKSNFVTTCSHYTVNSKGFLCRDGKVVVHENELEKLWSQYHDHTGMNNAWKRIKAK